MSVKIMTIAWEIDVKGADKLVLLALADNASDEGYCYPSWETIMKKTGVSKGTLAKSLKALEKLNLIKRVSRKRSNGSDASNGYFVIENVGQSSETEHHPKVQKLNTQSSETEHLEPSVLTVSKKINKKDAQLLASFRSNFKHYKIKVSDETILDFLAYRREIGHKVKTYRAISNYVTELYKCVEAGYKKYEVIELMKSREWRSLKFDWIKRELELEKGWK